MLNEKFQGKYHYLRLGYVKISVEERKANVTFLVPEDIYDYVLKSEDVNAIKDAVIEALGNGFTVFCRYEKIILTEESVKSSLIEYMSRHFPLISANLDFSVVGVTIGEKLALSFSVQKNIREYMEKVSFDQKIKEYFLSKYAIDTTLSFEIGEDTLAEITADARVSAGRYGKSVEVEEKSLICGKLSDLHSPAVHISTLKGEGEDAVCCGKISYLSFKTRDESKKDTFKKFFKHFYTFSISDTTGYLNVFLNTDTEYPALQNGAEVICKGRVNTRDDSSSLSMYAKAVATCKIPFSVIEEQTKPLDPPENYSVIFPKEYREIAYDQIGFDFVDQGKVRHISSAEGVAIALRSLKTERFFVPYEVAMCKMRSGKITEYLHTYLKVAFTDGSDRAEFANQKGIAAPRLSTVIPDLIKFSAGETVIGLNPSAALDLLNATAKPLRYRFQNDIQVIQQSAIKEEKGRKGDALEEALTVAHAYLDE